MIRSRTALVLAALLPVCLAASAFGQDGPGYGGGPYGPGPYGGRGPGAGMGSDDGGPDGPYGMGPGGMGPDGMGPRGMGYGGGMGRRGEGGPDGGEGGPGGGGVELSEGGVKVRGGERSYYFHVPAHVAKPAPVVLVFHGAGGRPQGIARKSGWNDTADRNGFIVVYLQGSPSPSGRGGSWNVGGSRGNTTDDRAYVAAVLDDVRHNAQIDPARIYAAGHSMGGVFAYRLACEMSGTFAAIGVVSSTMIEKGCKPTSPVAVLHIHGSADDRIPLAGGRGRETARRMQAWPAPQVGVTAWAALDACAPRPSRSTVGDMNCETYDHCRAPVEMCVRQGGEHPWPAEATGRIWAFFAANPKVAQ